MSLAALERQIRPIYDAIDSGSNKTAIQTCNKVLKKHPSLDVVKALKALALVRSNRIDESLPICDEVLANKPVDLDTLSAMMHVLRSLGRYTDMVTMFDEAYRKVPNNEELGAQDFFANVRTGNWKSAQQIATKMHKSFKVERYLYWSIVSAVLQANDPTTPPSMGPILFKLAHRLLETSALPSHVSPDRFYVHLTILRALQQLDEANKLLDSEEGHAIVRTNLVVDELRRDIVKESGRWHEEGERALKKLTESKDRNWLEFLSVLDSIFSDIATESSEEALSKVEGAITSTRDQFKKLLETDGDGSRERGPLLALLELEKRARRHAVPSKAGEKDNLVSLIKIYIERFGDKTCCYDDLLPYFDLEGDELDQVRAYLDTFDGSFDSAATLRRTINGHKLRRYLLSEEEQEEGQEVQRVLTYLRQYVSSLAIGKGLPETELQPGDDLILLTAQALVGIWKRSGEIKWLYNAITVLEYASQRSKHSYSIRLHLIRLYRLLAAPSQALHHYRAMNIKSVQNDTLSHFVLAHASTFSLASNGDLTYTQECVEASQIYLANSSETAEFIVRAFNAEKYSQVADFIQFEDRLDNSLQRDLVKIEHTRMRLTHELAQASEIVDTELIELKFIFERQHHDNRDFEILPSFQPRGEKTFDEKTLALGTSPGYGWLKSMLRALIRVFQLASDFDDSVEEKLLIGDRPKALNTPEGKVPIQERLQQRKPDELAELTPDELALFDFAMALSDWLGPYHDYARPPPAVALAQATKAQETRNGKQGKPLTPESSGAVTPNGTGLEHKKGEEPPAVSDAPEVVGAFFNNMAARFKTTTESGVVPCEALHITMITREALILFAIATIRFKSPAVSKKFSGLNQSIKVVRTNGIDVLKSMSTFLVKQGENEATSEQRRAFVDLCKPIQEVPPFENDLIMDVAKKVTDARKRLIEGVGKGTQKVIQILP